MKIDLGKILGIIGTAMQVVNNVKSANGKDKLDAVVASTPALIASLEAGIDKDILNDPKVIEAESSMISAIKSFANAVDAAKHLKGTGLPVTH